MRRNELDPIEILRRLIAIDTTSSRSNREAAEFAAQYLSDLGCRVELLAGHSEGKVLCLAHAGPDDGEGLMLCGHLDTVPADEPDWRSDPFSLHETETELYGRGSADMKGFDALAVHALGQAASRRLEHGVALLLTYDEEVGLGGAQHFREIWDDRMRLPRSVLVGEPTELEVIRAHKGYLTFEVTVPGLSAHSAYPHLGRNAVVRAAETISRIEVLGRRLRREREPSSGLFREVPHPTVNVASISGGDALNVVPGRCRLEGSARLLPGQEIEDFVEQLRRTVEVEESEGVQVDESREDRGGRTRGAGSISIRVLDYSPPMWTEEDARVHRELCDLVQQTESRGVAYASDAGPLSSMGFECVLFGPGSIEVAHKANENMPKAAFALGGALLESAIRRFCG